MAAHTSLQGASAILRNLSKVLPDLEALYKDIPRPSRIVDARDANGGASRPTGSGKLVTR